MRRGMDSARVLRALLAVSLLANAALAAALAGQGGGAEQADSGQTGAALSEPVPTLADPSPTETPVRAGYTLPPESELSRERDGRASYFANFSAGPTDIVFLGDSMIELFEWGDVLPGRRVKNRGIAGETTGNVADRLGDVVALDPQAVVIMAGINDIGMGIDQSTILENYERILRALREGAPQADVYVMSVLPTDRLPHIDNRAVVDLNAQLAALCRRYAAHYVDLFPHMAREDFSLDAAYHSDGVHLNETGYHVWLRELLPLLDGE